MRGVVKIMDDKNKPIGIFDSGLGGLTVINAIKSSLPKESFIYVGDTARIPYGEKDVSTIRSYGRQIISFLQKKEVKAVIVACGTISSNVIEDLRAEFSLPIIDVVHPCIEAALTRAKKRIGVIATAATVRSGFFQRKLKEKGPHLEVYVKACPLFVPLIEEGWYNSAVTAKIIAAYLQEWREYSIDTLILGCTHYPLLAAPIQQILNGTTLIDMAESTITSTGKYLAENGLNNLAEISKKYYVSGDTEKFNQMAGKITNETIFAKKIYWE